MSGLISMGVGFGVGFIMFYLVGVLYTKLHGEDNYQDFSDTLIIWILAIGFSLPIALLIIHLLK